MPVVLLSITELLCGRSKRQLVGAWWDGVVWRSGDSIWLEGIGWVFA